MPEGCRFTPARGIAALKQWQERNMRSDTDLARDLQISRSTLWAIKLDRDDKRRRKPTARTVARILEVLNIDISPSFRR